MKEEKEIYMMFEATNHGGIIRLAHRGGMRDAGCGMNLVHGSVTYLGSQLLKLHKK